MNSPEPFSWKGFSRRLGKNLVGVVHPDHLLFLLGAGGATAAAHSFDSSTRRYFARASRFGTAEEVLGEQLGHQAVAAAGIAALAGLSRIYHNRRLVRVSDDLIQGYLVNNLYTAALKAGVRRLRPNGANRRSFPSGHTSTAFMVATVFSRHYGLKATLAAYLGAAFVGASRLDENAHFLSDVVAGAALGYLVGRTVTRRPRSHSTRRINWAPLWSPSQRRAGLSFSASF